MAQTARSEAEKATDNVAELGKRTADKAVDVTREAADKAEDATRRGFQAVQNTAGAALEVEGAMARRSADAAAEFGQVLAEVMSEQNRRNVELFRAFTRTVDWKEVAQLQGEFLRESMERMVQLTQRYFELGQAVMTTAAGAAKDQARKAA